MNSYKFYWLLLLVSCIGVDHIDDPIVDARLELVPNQLSLVLGEERSISSTYFNKYGVDEPVEFEWISRNETIVSVASDGHLTANSVGQVYIVVVFQNLNDSALVTVVEPGTLIASVTLSTPKTELGIGETIQLEVLVTNTEGEEIVGLQPVFTSSDPVILSVSSSGEVQGLATGTATVTASVESIESLPVTLSVGENIRTGTFQSTSGYQAVGMATLSRNSENDLILTFSTDFATSFALGTFVYMANITSGTQVKGGGLDLGEITSNGAKEFNISSFNPEAELNTYRYVIILCKPASLTFGYAELN